MIERQGRYLLCRRPEHKRHGLLWEFPGGKLEADETLLLAAVRELREELNMQVLSLGAVRLKITDEASGFLICFVEVEATGEPLLLEHSELVWATPAEMKNLALAPSDRAFVSILTAD